jgi:TorA maturation chaperone TorD
MVERLESESLYLAVLGGLLATAPEHEQLARLVGEQVFSAIPFASEQPATKRGTELLELWADGYAESQIGDIRADYLRLFEGPGMPKAPIWESVYTNDEGRLLFQKETLQVRAWYSAWGLEIPNKYREPDDSLPYELQFVAHLAGEAAAAAANGDADLAQKNIEAKRRFCSEHLLRWGFEWCTLTKKEARTTFYQGLAELVEGVLAQLDNQTETSSE